MFQSNVFGISTKGQSQVVPFTVERHEPTENELLIDILYCGICHSDVEILSDNWGVTKYPCVPGHEAVGVVAGRGPKATKYHIGDVVGVGCMINSCQQCSACSEGWENHCEGSNGPTMTYGGYLTPKSQESMAYNTFGAWADKIVVPEHFVVSIPDGMDLAKAAPLLCPGTATYGPLKRLNITSDSKIGIVGFGGPGELANIGASVLLLPFLHSTDTLSEFHQVISLYNLRKLWVRNTSLCLRRTPRRKTQL